jgi:hypothetical protein
MKMYHNQQAVLMIGTMPRFCEKVHLLSHDAHDVDGNPLRGFVIMDGVRYVQVSRPDSARGWGRNTTTYHVLDSTSVSFQDVIVLCKERYAKWSPL